jgi:DNA-binding transcriptional regulator YbjK
MATKLAPSQERSRQRRDDLLRAAIKLIAEGGPKAVTHRAVAAAAGLPPATTTYYFDSILELTEEALRLHVIERVAELQALADAARTDTATAEEVAWLFIQSFADRSHQSAIAQYEVYLEAARNPALRQTVAEALDAFERLAETVLTAVGARHPARAAGAFVALIDGFTLHNLARPRPSGYDVDGLFEAMRALLIAQVASESELDRWSERLRQPLVGMFPENQ